MAFARRADLYLDAIDLNGLIEVNELRACQSILKILLSVQALAGASAHFHKVLQEHAAHLARGMCHEDLTLHVPAVPFFHV